MNSHHTRNSDSDAVIFSNSDSVADSPRILIATTMAASSGSVDPHHAARGDDAIVATMSYNVGIANGEIAGKNGQSQEESWQNSRMISKKSTVTSLALQYC